ncbi:MAG: 23S rRNA (uracil(1939)-C(5))-methyltransferase RlmD [Lysobacteraceae bacterium]|nr:MAG: 23S rRNA (uracil(1939)-C(5))-methyltransferase RlmD [Xanthomonadaceae bacterium]
MGRRARLPSEPIEADIVDLSHDGRGVARVDGKVTFISGVLPGEKVRFKLTGRRKDFDSGEVVEVLTASADRVDAKCPHFGRCGGCALQHLASDKQIEFKQKTLADNFQRIGQIEPEQWLQPLQGPQWGYRRKARLSVRAVRGKGRVLVGFREQNPRFVADIARCEVLVPSVGENIEPLAELIDGMQARDRIAQIEVAADSERTILVLRNLDPLSDSDTERLKAFSEHSGLEIWLQPGGPKTVQPLTEDRGLLRYQVEDGLDLQFAPLDFVQVNTDINQLMVQRVLEELQLDASTEVLDLFCGLGNFSLPIAKRSRRVVGIEGEPILVDKARQNAQANGIDNAQFEVADLMEPVEAPWTRESFSRVLLDPPRSGAIGILPTVAKMAPQRIVYVSCHPGSLARDAGILVNEHGYRLLKAGVMDMFPHTAHVESLAVFEKPQ